MKAKGSSCLLADVVMKIPVRFHAAGAGDWSRGRTTGQRSDFFTFNGRVVTRHWRLARSPPSQHAHPSVFCFARFDFNAVGVLHAGLRRT